MNNIAITTFIICLNLVTLNLHASDLLINNITVVNPVDNNNVDTLKHHWVLIKNGRIHSISKTKIVNQSKVIEIDGTGKFLIPGLMDAHVHTGTMPGIRADFTETKKLQEAFLKQQPRSYLFYGITQILDPSSTPANVAKFSQAPIKPDMFHCGAAPIIGGYNLLDANLEQAIKQRKYFIYQPGIDADAPNNFDANRHSPEMVVKRMAEDGAICVKVYTEDGFDKASHWPTISNNLLKRVRVAANKYGLKMMAHANAVDMQKMATNVDVDILGHGMWNWLDLTSKEGLPDEVQSIADTIINKSITYQPTLNVMRSLRDVTDSTHLHHPDYKNVISASTLDWYHSENGQWFSRVLQQGWQQKTLPKIQQHMTTILNNGERVLQYLYKKGHPLVLATDTPPAPTYASQPGVSANWELKHLYKLGVSLANILSAATINNAKSLNINNDYGSITKNKIANLLILNADPLKHISAYDKIHTVILHGVSHKRDSFKIK